MSNNITITEKEFEIIRESYFYENSKGLIFVSIKMVEDGISEKRAVEIMENINSLQFPSGKLAVIRRRKSQPRESLIFQYLDIRAIILGLMAALMIMALHNVDKIALLFLR